jgi:hypothetical protein
MKKRSISPLIKHANHNVEVRLVSGSNHYGKIHCVDCNKWVTWLSRAEVNLALEQGLVNEQSQA